ncbi:MAG: hypothetical protein SX243_00205 [Acidobacteriota bacterium]|nr:hypothetical protein [Acidobacteriota bacterium]
MEPTLEQVEQAVLGVQHWLSSPNIQYIGAREFEKGDYRLEVHVEKKKAREEMGPSDLFVPPTVEHHTHDAEGAIHILSIRTKVVEVGPIRLAALDEKKRPAPGGYKISVSEGFFSEGTGTLGCNLAWSGKYRLLTNNHVISKNGNIGGTVYQPEQGLFGNSLTSVTGYMPVTAMDSRNPPVPTFNRYDFAYCNMTTETGATNIYGIGQPTGYRAPVNGENVKWVGQVTAAVQTTTIAGLVGRAVISWKDSTWAFFDNVITFAAGTVAQGDSGSAVVGTNDMKVVGLIFATNATGGGYALRIPPY